MPLYAMPPALSDMSIVIVRKLIIRIIDASLAMLLVVMLDVASFTAMLMLSVIMPSVVAPQFYLNRKTHFRNFCQF